MAEQMAIMNDVEGVNDVTQLMLLPYVTLSTPNVFLLGCFTIVSLLTYQPDFTMRIMLPQKGCTSPLINFKQTSDVLSTLENVHNSDTCCNLCKAEASRTCVSFTYATIIATCWLHDKIGPVLHGQGYMHAVISTVAESEGGCTAAFSGYKSVGTLLDSAELASRQECCSKCETVAQCASYEYDIDKSTCSTYVTLKFNPTAESTIVGIRESYMPFNCFPIWNYNIASTTLVIYSGVASPFHCCAMCIRDTACLAYTYDLLTQTCNFKQHFGDRYFVKDLSKVSGAMIATTPRGRKQIDGTAIFGFLTLPIPPNISSDITSGLMTSPSTNTSQNCALVLFAKFVDDCLSLPSYRHHGNDLFKTPVVASNVRQCCSLCKLRPPCLSVTFKPPNKCYMHSKIGPVQPNPETTHAIPISKFNVSADCNHYWSYNLWGVITETIADVHNVSMCCDLCKQNYKCQYFVYHPRKAECQLRRRGSQWVHDNDAVTGGIKDLLYTTQLSAHLVDCDAENVAKVIAWARSIDESPAWFSVWRRSVINNIGYLELIGNNTDRIIRQVQISSGVDSFQRTYSTITLTFIQPKPFCTEGQYWLHYCTPSNTCDAKIIDICNTTGRSSECYISNTTLPVVRRIQLSHANCSNLCN